MDRAELERLDRTTLIAEAEALGVSRANILTRPELMDELLVRSARKDDGDLPKARGFFGRARDLVARVIEKGLHLPDAAERLRAVTAAASEIAARVAPSVVPTVTLAEIYAAQGHRPRAIETLEHVLEVEPDHTAAQALLTKLRSPPTVPPAASAEPEPAVTPDRARDPAPAAEATPAPASAPAPLAKAPPPPAVEPLAVPVEAPPSTAPEVVSADAPAAEPIGFLDDEPLPGRYDVDECVAIAVDPTTLYVYWEIRTSTFEHIRRTRADGTLTLRLLIITPAWDGPRSVTRDFDVEGQVADRVVRELPAGSIVRAAIGWRTGDAFRPIAHAPALETPPGAECPVVADGFVRWTPKGRSQVTPLDSDYASIGRALGKFVPRSTAAPYERSRAPLGSSEVSAGFGRGAPAASTGEGLGASPLNAPSSEALL